MKPLAPLLLLTLFLLPLHADEQTKQIQSALKDAGFYYGAVDGAGGDETTAALRRYQIRNGLEVTGSATAETLASLKIQGTPAGPLPDKIVPTPPVEAADPGEVTPPFPPPDAFVGPNETKPPVTPPAPVVKKVASPALGDFFAGTEYAGVSREEQSLRLAKAQSQLRQLGYYSGNPDGLPGPNTEEALLKFQRANDLHLTGKLDTNTTKILNATAAAIRGKRVRRVVVPQSEPPAAIRGVWVH